MMSNILEVKEKIALKYALDLGIALQLTNITRDILEDANMNRVYIPTTWYKFKASDIRIQKKKNQIKLKISTVKLLNISEKYYKSAIKGLAFLTLRNRFAILIALMIYRQIGIKIIKNKFSNLHKREKVTFFEKILCMLICIKMFLFDSSLHKKNYNHNKSLHKFLKNLPIFE